MFSIITNLLPGIYLIFIVQPQDYSMSLQDIFYVVSIVYMTLFIVLMIGLVIVLFYIKRTIDQVCKTVNEKIAVISHITSEPKDFAASVGAAVAHSAMKRVKKMMGR